MPVEPQHRGATADSSDNASSAQAGFDIEPAGITLRRLVQPDAAAYRDLMLAAYGEPGDAFTSSVAERQGLPLDWWQHRLGQDSSAEECVLGAFAAQAGLVGAAGLSREPREKLRHKATLFGMVIAPAWRGQGLGRRLVLAVLDQARSQTGLRVVQLTVTEANAQACQLYERCGFSCFGIEPLAVQAPVAAGGYVAKRHLWIDLAALPER
jgi:RimJ/RimL family protein N-acetyltransferase